MGISPTETEKCSTVLTSQTSNRYLSKSEIDELLNQNVDDELIDNYRSYIREIDSTSSHYYTYHFGLLNDDEREELDFDEIDYTGKGIGV